MKLTCPALLFVTISQNEIDSSSLTAFFLIVLAQYVASVIGGKILCVYCRKRGWEEKYMAMLEVTTATSNNGFIGLPVALMFLGEFGGLCMSAGFFGIHLYLWTYAVRVLQGNTGEKMTVKEIMQKLMNPNCVMVFAGLVFSLMGWTPLLPAFVMDAMSMLGNMSTPLSLIYIGAMAGNEGILQLIHKRKAVETALVRMIFFPLVTIGLVYFLPIDAVVKTVCVVSMACPCAAIMPMVVEQYGKLWVRCLCPFGYARFCFEKYIYVCNNDMIWNTVSQFQSKNPLWHLMDACRGDFYFSFIWPIHSEIMKLRSKPEGVP